MIELFNKALEKNPAIGFTASAVGATMPLIEAVTKIAQCGAAICGFALGAWTLYLTIKKHRGKQ